MFSLKYLALDKSQSRFKEEFNIWRSLKKTFMFELFMP